MTTKVIITKSADRDLLEIGRFIALDSLERAISFIHELQEKVEKTLSLYPNSGSVYKDELRYFVVRGYVFIYEYNKKQDVVLVLNVHSPRQDWR